jgi:hypothetical protein
MGLARAIRRLRNKAEEKTSRKRRSKALLEPLEPRLLLSADLKAITVGAADDTATNLETENGVDTAQVIGDSAQGFLENPLVAGTGSAELIFVDPRVQDYEVLTQGLKESGDIVVLDVNQDGVRQIADSLAEREEVSAVHILSHGAAGKITLGSSMLDAGSLESYAEELRSWGKALSEEGDLLFYGCSIGQGEAGISLVTEIARLTGADVTASVNTTGAAVKGGDCDFGLSER